MLSALHTRVPVVSKLLMRLEPVVVLGKALEVERWLPVSLLVVVVEARLHLTRLSEIVAVKVHLVWLKALLLATQGLETTSNLLRGKVASHTLLVVEDLRLGYALQLDYL